jgi:hypothetical protein
LIVEVDPLFDPDVVFIVAVIVKDVEYSVVIFVDVFRLSGLLEDLGHLSRPQFAVPGGIHIEDLLEDLHHFAFKGAFLVEEDVLVEPLALDGFVYIKSDVSVGRQIADLFF